MNSLTSSSHPTTETPVAAAVQNFSLTFRLDGAGWIKAHFSVAGSDYDFTGSYLLEPLADFLSTIGTQSLMLVSASNWTTWIKMSFCVACERAQEK